MSKRRASSPCENPIQKKPSMSAIAAATAYHSVPTVPVKDVQSRKTIRMVQVSQQTSLREPSKASIQQQPKRQSLKPFTPWERTSTTNLRPRRSLPPVPETSSTPFKPGLSLSGHDLQTPPGSSTGCITIASILLFPTTLALIKPTWPSCFTINMTPQLGPPLPSPIAEALYSQHVCSSPLLRPGKLPYLHLGNTMLGPGFRLNFYLILPNAGGPPHAVNTGHLSDEVLQTVFDNALIPALETAEPKRSGFKSWMQAMNEANFKPLKARRKSYSFAPEIQEERLHCLHLSTIWSSILSSIQHDEEIAHILDGYVLIAYGERSDEYCAKPGWGEFKRVWENAIEVKKLGRESKVNLEMGLQLDMGLDEEAERDRNKKWDKRRRVRR